MIRRQTAMCLVFLTIFSIFCGVLCSSGFAETAAPVAKPYGKPMDGTIRLLLESLGIREALGLTIAGSYSVDGDRGFQFDPGTEIKVGLEGGHITLKAGGLAIDMGGGFTLVRHLQEDGGAQGVYIHESAKDAQYLGDISFGVQPGGGLRVIVTMDIEEYLYGVLPYEMSDSFPIEALKAQAVSARSYAMQRKAANTAKDHDVVDTPNDQVYKGFDARFLNPIQAVDETRGIVGMVDDSFAEMFYSASNGGQTALATDVWGKGDYGYLDIREDSYDLENPESVVKKAVVPKEATELSDPLYTLLLDVAAQKLFTSGRADHADAVGIARVEGIEAINPVNKAGRQYKTLRFTVKGSIKKSLPDGKFSDPETVDAPIMVDLSFYDQVRSALNISINASAFDLVEITETDDSFAVINRRYGHGVGLSQRGAQWMAGNYGKSYLEILDFYYPGLEFVQMTWTEKPLMRAAALPESLGYAAARPTPAPTPAPLPPLKEGEALATVIVEGVDSTLNVRQYPTTDAKILGVVRNGSPMIVQGQTADGWAKMMTMELDGYVLMRFIAMEEDVSLPLITVTMPPATEETLATPAPVSSGEALPNIPSPVPSPAPTPVPPSPSKPPEEGVYVF